MASRRNTQMVGCQLRPVVFSRQKSPSRNPPFRERAAGKGRLPGLCSRHRSLRSRAGEPVGKAAADPRQCCTAVEGVAKPRMLPAGHWCHQERAMQTTPCFYPGCHALALLCRRTLCSGQGVGACRVGQAGRRPLRGARFNLISVFSGHITYAFIKWGL